MKRFKIIVEDTVSCHNSKVISTVKKEIMTEIKRLDNDYAIPLPVTFCKGTTIGEETELKVIYNERGNPGYR